MLKTIESGENGKFSSDPSKHNIVEKSSRQGGILNKPLRVISALFMAGSAILPSFLVEARPNEDGAVTLLQGDGSKDRLNILLLSYTGTTTQMLQEVAEDIFLIPPTDEFKNKTNVYTKNPTEDLRCDQNAACDYNTVIREIERVVNLGVIPHETMIVIKSNEQFRGAGLAGIAGRFSPPDIYTISAVVRPEGLPPHTEGPRRLFYASAIAHELWGHAFAGFDHEGGDIMDNSIQGSARLSFNTQHTQFLRQLVALGSYRYLTPKEIKGATGSLSLKADLSVPTGTTQQKRLITPANNDGPVITLLRNLESSFIVPAPQIGVGNYILLPDMTYTWTEWSSNKPTALDWNSPEWDQVQAWPNIFLPNPPVEIKIKTPKRFSDGITLTSLGTTNDRTPILTWSNVDPDVFYYEVQVSKDSSFNTDPSTASAMVYWELRHGGVTKPANSYTIPDNFPLEKGTDYFWRVRPRVQGDGTPVSFSNIGSFKTSVDARVLAANELEGITQPTTKQIITKEEHERNVKLAQAKDAERLAPMWNHWQWVNRRVQSDWSVYRRQEDLASAA